LHDSVTVLEVSESVEFPQDPKDAMFLACALAVDADFLISGDKDLHACRLQHTVIISVRDFKRIVCDNWA
jgi:predicted nucleic acid-binding protein